MLYRQYYDYLFRFAYRVTRRLDRVEDIINEVMLVVWQKAHATEPLARASTWSMSVAHKKALCAVSKSPALIARDDEISVSDAEFAPDELTRIEANELFESALGHLTPEQRAGWEFVHYHENALQRDRDSHGYPGEHREGAHVSCAPQTPRRVASVIRYADHRRLGRCCTARIEANCARR